MSTVVDLKTKEEKDAELDRRIEALRKKNEALVKRYQEIQEDKKKAEQEGIAVTTHRKPRPHEPETERRKTEKENFTVMVDLSKPAPEKRVVNDRKPGPHHVDHEPEEGDSGRPHGESPAVRTGSGRLSRGGQRGGRREPRPHKGELWAERQTQDGEGGEGPARNERSSRGGRRGGRGGGGGGGGGGGVVGGGAGGGAQGGSGSDRKSKEWEEKRRQNIEKMNEEMEKIAEYERGQRADGEKNPIRNFLDDPRRSGPIPEADRKEGSRRHVRNWGGVDFDNVKTGTEMEKEWTSRRPGGKGSVDMTLSMTGRERAEYLRWKKEREQIDEERLARHRNATGQWRREWDAQKTDTMFKEDPAVAGEATPEQSSRREDSKRPPKAPTFGDFLGQGKPRQGGRGRGRMRGQGKSYSMHDNRWEGENEEEKGKKEETEMEKKEKEKDKEKENEKEEDKPKASSSEKTGDGGLAEDEDEEEWEDASDGEEVEDEEEHEKAEHEEGKESPKDAKPTEKSPTSPAPSTPSPKAQRTPRPKVHIPSPQETLSTPEGQGPKPLSPFSPLEGHQPVSDWGEEMEMLSPRSSLGESPLKPSSTESSPAQPKSNKTEENTSTTPSQPEEPEEKESTSTVEEPATCETQNEPEPTESADPITPSSQDTADPVPPPAADTIRQSEDSEVPAVEEDQIESEKKTEEEPAVDSSEQPSSGAVLITSFETVAFRKKSLTSADF